MLADRRVWGLLALVFRDRTIDLCRAAGAIVRLHYPMTMFRLRLLVEVHACPRRSLTNSSGSCP